MKKLFAITFAFCAVIVAMACGSNDPDVLTSNQQPSLMYVQGV